MRYFDDEDVQALQEQERSRAYVTGTTDQFTDDAEYVRDNLYSKPDTRKSSYRATKLDNCYPNGNFSVCKHFADNPLFREEFNRKFNMVVEYHSKLWRDTPFHARDKEHYAYRYYRFFEDLMFLLEEYPDACSDKDYRAVVNARKSYRDQYDREWKENYNSCSHGMTRHSKYYKRR